MVTKIGDSTPLSEARVDASNWMTALTLARNEIGEKGGVPPGASCSVAPDGKVTIQDAVARKTYVLAPWVEESLAPASTPRGPRVPSEPVPRPGSVPPPNAEGRVSVPKPSDPPPAAKVSPKRTMAYDARELGLAAPAKPAASPSKKTIAYDAKQLGLSAPAEPTSSGESASTSAAPASAASTSAAPEKARPKPVAKKTMAYDAKELGLTPPSAAPTESAPSESAPSQSVPSQSVPSEPPAKKVASPDEKKSKPIAKKTIAYDARELGLAAASPAAEAAPAPEPAQEPAKAPVSKRTIAYDAKELGLGGDRSTVPDAAPPEQDAPEQDAPEGWGLLHARDEEPTKETPLCYRERTFVVPPGTTPPVAEAILMARFDELQHDLAERPKGKLVNMAVFDHRWEERPERPPLITLQWKDWRGAPVIRQQGAPAASPSQPAPSQPSTAQPAPSQPPAAQPAPSQPPAAQPAPSQPPGAQPAPSQPPAAQPAPSQPPVAQPASSQPPAARRSEPAPRGVDDRLANAFEALQDLFFLTTPVEGLDFVLELLADRVPSEASSACLYDINSDELRFVALRGPGAPERQGEGVPRLSGLMGAAATSSEGVLLSENVPHDVRFDPGVDGRIGLEPVTMALMSVTHQGRLLGMIQLINRQQQAQFSRADANLIAYVSEKLGEFLYSARMRSDQRRA